MLGVMSSGKQNYSKPLSLVIILPAESTVKSYKNTQ